MYRVTKTRIVNGERLFTFEELKRRIEENIDYYTNKR
ncbi:hypothetical protein [Neobacillus drentensis]